MMTSNKTKAGLSIFTLTFLISGAIDSIRNLPAASLFGSTLIFFFIFGAIFFLIPVALVSAELSSTWTQEGGVYSWVRKALGEKIAFLAIWLQWINTMVWYPTILSFIAGTLSFLINPHLAENKFYLIAVILGTFWSLTLINLKGVQTSARFASACAILGMVIPMALIISLAIAWVASGKPLQIHPTIHTIFPNFSQVGSWVSLTAIMTSFLGMELATVHVKNVYEPQKSFPKALFFSVTLILITMIFGSLAIAIVLPRGQINLVEGVMQAFQDFFAVYHISWLIPVVTILLLIGSLGSMVNWIISPARGLLQAAQHDFLPKFLEKENKHGVASNLLLIQAALVTLVCLVFLLMPTVNDSYWLLTDLSTELYMVMYVLFFISALVIKYKFVGVKRPFHIPGGKLGTWVVCLLGIIGSIITLVIGFFPPAELNINLPWSYEAIFAIGIVVMIVPSAIFYGYNIYQKKKIFGGGSNL